MSTSADAVSTCTDLESCSEYLSNCAETPDFRRWAVKAGKNFLSSASTTDELSDAQHLYSKRGFCSSSDSEPELDAESTRYHLTFLLRVRSALSRRASSVCTQKPLGYGSRRYQQLPNWARPVEDAPAYCEDAPKRTRCNTAPAVVAALSPTPGGSVLAPSSGAWVSNRRVGSESAADKMKRSVRSILNKLTLEKFEALYEQLATCGLSTSSDVAILMSEIFEKATSQHHFIEMYADLCVRLEGDPRLVSACGPAGGESSFRHLLLAECQSSFERLLEPQLASENECEDSDVLRRKMALGNVKLVGYLLVKGILSSRLLVACCDALLRGRTTCPEALESVAALLTVAGKRFDLRKDWQHADRLRAIFAKIADLSKDKKVSARSRFLLRDLLDLRDAVWCPQNTAIAKEKPMRLDKVREQAQSAPQQNQMQHRPAEHRPAEHRPAEYRSAEHRPAARVGKSEKPVVPVLPAARSHFLPTRADLTQQGSDTTPRTGHVEISAESTMVPGPCGSQRRANIRNQKKRSTPRTVETDGNGFSAAAQLPAGPRSPANTTVCKPCAGASQTQDLKFPIAEQKQCQLYASVSASSGQFRSKVASAAEHSELTRLAPKRTSAEPVLAAKAQVEPVQQIITKVEPPVPSTANFTLKVFRKELSAILKDLSTHRNVAVAVGRVREQYVPVAHQARQFVDLLTRAAEETRGPARRSAFAFAAGLAAGEPNSAFDRTECLKGVSTFFTDVFDDLKEEVPRLPAMVASELVPTLRSVFPLEALANVLPHEFAA